MGGVSGGPSPEGASGANCGNGPEFETSVALRTQKERDARQSEEEMIERSKDGRSADPRREARTEIVEAIENPTDDPKKNVGLAFQRINVGIENADQQGGEKESESDNGLNHQEK